jgi:NTE family protein
MPETGNGEQVALVLAGGGARGAYEVGVLSVLLPRLEAEGRSPTILLGNSVGALNAMYVAAHAHQTAAEITSEGKQLWEGFRWSDVFAHVTSPLMAMRGLAYLGEFLGVPGARLWSLLDPSPLKGTIEGCIDFDVLRGNVLDGTVHAAAVVATSALTRRSVVFHHGGGLPSRDPDRLIDYVPTPVEPQHVMASAAIPGVFPAIEVKEPEEAKGWYADGGTRLNVPIKPALEFGAKRVVAIGLSSMAQGPQRIAGDERPDVFGGISHIVQGLLDDQMVQDVHTLAKMNELARAGAPGRQEIPYIIVTPEQPYTLEEIAARLFRRRYTWIRGLFRSRDILLLGRLMGVRSAVQNATLLSMLLFDAEFAAELIALGESDAKGWLAKPHRGGGIWEI